MYAVPTQTSQHKKKKKTKNLLSLRPKPQGNPPKPLFCVPESSTTFLSWKPAVQHSTKLSLPNFACVNQVHFIGNYSSQSLFHVFR